jgi:hypothetical protein
MPIDSLPGRVQISCVDRNTVREVGNTASDSFGVVGVGVDTGWLCARLKSGASSKLRQMHRDLLRKGGDLGSRIPTVCNKKFEITQCTRFLCHLDRRKLQLLHRPEAGNNQFIATFQMHGFICPKIVVVRRKKQVNSPQTNRRHCPPSDRSLRTEISQTYRGNLLPFDLIGKSLSFGLIRAMM